MIVFIVPGLRETSPINWLVSLVLRLQNEFDVLVFSMDDDIYTSLNKERLLNSGIKVVYGRGAGFSGFILNFFAVSKLLQQYRPNVIFSLLIRADFLASMMGARTTSVSSLRNMVDEEYTYTYGKFLGRILSWLHLGALRRIDHSVAMSVGMRARLLQLGISNVHLIPNSIDTNIVKSLIDDCSLEKPPARFFPKIVIVGSLISRKQVMEMLHALWDLHKGGYYFYVDIIGSGPDNDKIVKFLKSTNSEFRSHIVLSGHVNNVIEKIMEADIFLMNSSSEGVSRALMEAMYIGLVVVVRRNHGSVDLIEDRVTGYLYDTLEEMTAILKDYYLDSGVFHKAQLSPCFTMEFNANSYLELLYKLDH